MPDNIYISSVKNGRLQANISKMITSDLQRYEGKDVLIRIGLKRKVRSENQNRYYWGVVCRSLRDGVKDTWGEDIDSEAAHDILKTECNYKEVVKEDSGELLKIPVSTSALNTLQFEEYLERCRKFIYQWFGIVVPLPNEQTILEL